MHMKLSRLSSDMCTAHKISVYIYIHARYTSMHAYGILCARLCNKEETIPTP